jgi:hypothetical protein
MTHASRLCGQPDDPYGKTWASIRSAPKLSSCDRLNSAEVAQQAVSARVRTAVDLRDTAASEVVAVHHARADLPANRPSVLVVTLAVGQIIKAAATRRGQV